jgi:hypothetical protein
MTNVRVSLEAGRRWVVATALDWPGWCRRGRGEQAAVDTLIGYAVRYARIAGPSLWPGEFEVVATVAVHHPAQRLARARPRLGDRGPDPGLRLDR